jgi:diguanylate cyclase (GGDEF)-like protein
MGRASWFRRTTAPVTGETTTAGTATTRTATTAAPEARDGRAAAAVAATRRAAAAGAPDAGGDDVGAMLDAVGAMVQAVGTYAIDVDGTPADETRERADAWRRHVSAGFAHPDAPDDGEGAGSTGTPMAARDWAGAARFVVGQRRTERQHVSRALDELRATVWTLVNGLHQVVGADADAGRASASVLVRVRKAVEGAPADGLREAALSAVADLSSLVQEREQARRSQLAALGAEVSKLGQALDDARREGALDVLTGLGNRRAFDDAVANAFALQALWGQPTSVIVFSVDNLPEITERLGQPGAELALCAVAARLTRVCLRRSDALCRQGDAEFAAVLRETNAAEAARVAEKVVAWMAEQGAATRVALADDASGDGRPAVGPVRLSAGVAEIGPGDATAERWIARATAALAEQRGVAAATAG